MLSNFLRYGSLLVCQSSAITSQKSQQNLKLIAYTIVILELSESTQLLLYSLIHTQVNTHTWSEQRLALGGRGRVRLEKVSKVLDSLLQARHLTVDMNNPWKQMSTILNISVISDWFFHTLVLCSWGTVTCSEYLITFDRLQSM